NLSPINCRNGEAHTMSSCDNGSCCQLIGYGQVVTSPFNRMIVFDYYDGPTGGLLLCDVCSTLFRFVMVDWNTSRDVRIFALARLPQSSLSKVLAFCGEAPQWPV